MFVNFSWKRKRFSWKWRILREMKEIFVKSLKKGSVEIYGFFCHTEFYVKPIWPRDFRKKHEIDSLWKKIFSGKINFFRQTNVIIRKIWVLWIVWYFHTVAIWRKFLLNTVWQIKEFFLSLRFYVKSILEILVIQKRPFWHI